MSDIIVPGFKTVFDNDTYLRAININVGRKVKASEIVQLDRYRFPTKEELEALIVDICRDSIEPNATGIAKYFAKILPDDQERALIANNNGVIDLLMNSAPYFYQDGGRWYVQINYGVAENRDIRKLCEGEELEPEDYRFLIENQSYNPWATSTILETGLQIPSEREIELFFKNRVFRSSFLKVNCRGDPFLYDRIQVISRQFYRAMRHADLESLEDITDFMEEELAIKVMKYYARDKQMMGELKQEPAKQESAKKEDQPQKINFDLDNPFSRN